MLSSELEKRASVCRVCGNNSRIGVLGLWVGLLRNTMRLLLQGNLIPAGSYRSEAGVSHSFGSSRATLESA
jgi:hypothetical protein